MADKIIVRLTKKEPKQMKRYVLWQLIETLAEEPNTDGFADIEFGNTTISFKITVQKQL